MAACLECGKYIDAGAELASYLMASMSSCRKERRQYREEHGDRVAFGMAIGWLEGLVREAAGASVGLCQDCWEQRHGR